MNAGSKPPSVEPSEDGAGFLRSEEAARASEQWLRLAQEAARAGTWEWDLRTNENIWSEELWALYGLEPRSCVPSYDAWLATIHPEDRERAAGAVRAAAEAGTALATEWRVVGRDGTVRWLMSRGQPQRDGAGRVVRYLGIVLDITERKRAEERLAYLASFPERNLNAVLEFEPGSGRVAYMNPAARRCFPDLEERGTSHPYLAGLERLCGELQVAPARAREREVMIGERWYAQSIVHVPESARVRVYGYEITKRKEAEAARAHSAQQRQLALDAARMGWWHYDPVTRLASWDERYREIFGVTGYQRLNDEILAQMIHPDDLPALWKKVEAALNPAAPETFAAEYRIRRPDGAVRWIEAHGRATFEGEGEKRRATSFVGTVADITERKEHEERLHRFNRILRAHTEIHRALAGAEGEKEYLDHVCRTLVEVCGHAMAWIGLAEEDAGKTVRPAASAGFEEGYLESLHLTWADTERGRGPTGTAIRTGRPSGCANMQTDPAFGPWRDEALKRGYASSVALPLVEQGRGFGAVMIYARQPEAFSGEETALLSQLADDVARGVSTLRLQQAHRMAEAALRTRMAGIDAAADAVVITDPEGNIQYVNPAFTAMTGYSAAEAAGGKLKVLKSGRHAAAFYEEMWRTILAGRVWHGELINRRKDGTLYAEEMTITPVMNPEGRIQNFIAIKRDITERKRAEERLNELSLRLTYHVDHSPLAVIEWGPDMRLTRWSGAAERMFGWKAEEVLGKRMEDLRWVYQEDEQQVAAVSSELRSGANSKRFSANRNYRKDGEVIHCEWYNSSLLDASGKLVSILSLVLDVTQRDRAEEALRQLNVELEARVAERTAQLAAANADLRAQMEAYERLETEVAGLVEDERMRLGMELHDNLCQQLAAAGMQTAMLEKRLKDKGLPQAMMAARIAEALNQAGEDAHVLARGLLPVQVDREGLMVALGGLARRMEGMQGVACVFDCAAPVPVENNAVATNLFRIAQEAVHNAVKHARARQIVVELRGNGEVTLTIRDDGIGIPPEAQRGAGSGLRIMAYRARVIEGQLTVARGEAGGTVVRCILPRGSGRA